MQTLADTSRKYNVSTQLLALSFLVSIGLACFKFYYDDFTYWQHIVVNISMILPVAGAVMVIVVFKPDFVRIEADRKFYYLTFRPCIFRLSRSFSVPKVQTAKIARNRLKKATFSTSSLRKELQLTLYGEKGNDIFLPPVSIFLLKSEEIQNLEEEFRKNTKKG